MTTTAPTVPGVSTPRTSPTMGRARALVVMTRPTQILLIVAVFANGVLLALWRYPAAATETWAALLALLLVFASAVAVHLANEAADAPTDRLTTRTPYSGGSGALEASGMRPRVPLLIGLSMAALAGIGIAALTGLISAAAALLVTVGLLAGLAYSLPPVAAMRRGWGEALNTLLGALLLPLFGVAAVAGRFGLDDVIAFMPFVFVVFVSVMATAWPDRAADAATGKRTMQVRLRPTRLRHIAFATVLAFVAGTLLSMMAEAMPLALAGLLVLPLLAVGLHRYTRVVSPIANVAAMVGLTLLTTAALVVSLVAEGGLG